MARARVVAVAAVLAVVLAASCTDAKVDVSKWNLNATVISEGAHREAQRASIFGAAKRTLPLPNPVGVPDASVRARLDGAAAGHAADFVFQQHVALARSICVHGNNDESRHSPRAASAAAPGESSRSACRRECSAGDERERPRKPIRAGTIGARLFVCFGSVPCIATHDLTFSARSFLLSFPLVHAVLDKFGSDIHTSNAMALFRNAMSHSGRSLKEADSSSSLQTLLTSVLGSKWTDYLPSSWKTLTWASLGGFSLEDNIAEFFNSTALSELGNTTLKEAYDSAKDAVASVCGTDEITFPEKIPAYCVGPSISFQYVPKKCDIIESNKTIVCSSPKLVSVKSPAVCALGGIEGFSFEGKTCRIKGEIGLEMYFQAGGRPYSLTPSIVHGIFDKIFHGKDDDENDDDANAASTLGAPAPAPLDALDEADINENEEQEGGDEEETPEDEEATDDTSEEQATAPAPAFANV